MGEEEMRARYEIGVMGPGYPDIIGSIEAAHKQLSAVLFPVGLRPVGRPQIERASQNTMTLSWALAEAGD